MAGFLRRIVRSLAALTALCLCLGAVPVSAAPPAPPEISAPSALVYETQTGRILYEKNAHDRYFPASTTKILTALIAIENLDPTERIEFTASSIACVAEEARHFELQPGESMSVYSCLQALLIPSCNEAASAIAERIAGSEEEFAKLMNVRARQAGAIESHFVTPNGLHYDEHYVTAYDMAHILAACVQHPLYREISGSGGCVITDADYREYEYESNNFMLRADSPNHKDWVVCSKTGHTAFAGFALMTYGEKNGMHITCAILGGDGYQINADDTVALCEWCFDNYRVFHGEREALYCVRSVLGENARVEIGHALALVTPEMPRGPVLCDLGRLTYEGGGRFTGDVLLTLPDGSVQTAPFEAYVT